MNNNIKKSFGIPIGIDYYNVIAFSNNVKSKDIEKSYVRINSNNIFCGYKYQCVEYVRRWLILNYGITFQEVDFAYKLYTLDNIKFTNIWNKNNISYKKYPNGSTFIPTIGSIIVWDENKNYTTGHVAIVTKTDNDYVYIAEQNWDNMNWKNQYSRKLHINKINNNIILKDNNQYNLMILGWLNLT